MTSRILQTIKQHRFALPWVLLRKLLARVIKMETLVVFGQKLRGAKQTPVPRDPAVHILRVKEPDADVFLRLSLKYPYKNFPERLRAGQQCFVAMRHDNIAGYAWATSADIYLEEVARVYRVAPDEIFIYDCFVEAEYRGAGIYPAMLHAALAENRGRDGEISSACIAASAVNRASIRGILKAGFVERKKIRYIEFLRKRKWWGLDSLEQVSAC